MTSFVKKYIMVKEKNRQLYCYTQRMFKKYIMIKEKKTSQ